jgi:hypothetical protein
MHPLLRAVLAVIAGLVVGQVVNGGLGFLGLLIYPMPPGVGWKDHEAIAEWLGAAPPVFWLLPIFAHQFGCFVGAWVAEKLAPRSVGPALAIGFLFLTGGILNLFSIPHPLWFAIVDLALYLPSAWLGAKLAGPDHSKVIPA